MSGVVFDNSIAPLLIITDNSGLTLNAVRFFKMFLDRLSPVLFKRCTIQVRLYILVYRWKCVKGEMPCVRLLLIQSDCIGFRSNHVALSDIVFPAESVYICRLVVVVLRSQILFNHDINTQLFSRDAMDCLLYRFTLLNPPTGNEPLTFGWLVLPYRQQQTVVTHDKKVNRRNRNVFDNVVPYVVRNPLNALSHPRPLRDGLRTN